MATKIPGIRNVWTKALRVQPEGYHDAFVIEFENQAAADNYARDQVHDAWTESFLKIREASVSPQITNEALERVSIFQQRSTSLRAWVAGNTPSARPMNFASRSASVIGRSPPPSRTRQPSL